MRLVSRILLCAITLLVAQGSFAKDITVRFKHVLPTNGHEHHTVYLYAWAEKTNSAHRAVSGEGYGEHGLLLGSSSQDTLESATLAWDPTGEYDVDFACAYYQFENITSKYSTRLSALSFLAKIVTQHFTINPEDNEVIIQASCPLDESGGRSTPSDITIITKQ